MKRSKNLLVISGHDPTGGAGIQADIEVSRNFNIKVFSVLTCTTIQNTSKVTKVTSSNLRLSSRRCHNRTHTCIRCHHRNKCT